MQAKPDHDKRLIAWNGVHLFIPADWDARVAGLRHLVFEKDFQPRLQLRWEKPARLGPQALQEQSRRYAGRMGSLIAEDDLPPELWQLRDTFGVVSCYRGASGKIEGGSFLCTDRRSLVLFQLLSPASSPLPEASDCLATVSCRDQAESLWRIQDFSLTTPASYQLNDYTFGAGLSRLSFRGADLLLQTCTLGPADMRLGRHPLAEILAILTGTPDLETVTSEDAQSCSGHRSPTIVRQLFLRLRREKPFIRAKIWHDAGSNRLLAVVFSSNRPIHLTTILNLCGQYEILRKESSDQGSD